MEASDRPRFNDDDFPTIEASMVQLALLLAELRPTAADRVRIEQRVALGLRGVVIMPAANNGAAGGPAPRQEPPW